MDEDGEDFLLVVSIGAKVAVGAIIDAVGEMGAELLLVLLVVVVLLHEGVGEQAGVAIRAFLVLLDETAHLDVVEVAEPLPVFAVVVVDAVFMVVGFGDVAGGDFEDI
jgi:hypothetical protein